jgi:hypothetical protein
MTAKARLTRQTEKKRCCGGLFIFLKNFDQGQGISREPVYFCTTVSNHENSVPFYAGTTGGTDERTGMKWRRRGLTLKDGLFVIQSREMFSGRCEPGSGARGFEMM